MTLLPSGSPRRPRNGGRRRLRAGGGIGPSIEMNAVEKVEAHIAEAAKKRAKVVTNGEQNAFAGTVFEPPVLTENRQRGSSRNVVGRTSARTIDCA